jgi:GNAT superfamily N-acetyltransferase
VSNGATGTQVTARLPLMMTNFSAMARKSVHIRPATAEEYPLVMEIIGEAAGWLKARGIDQWPAPPNEHWQRRTAEQVSRGEFYLAYEGEKPVGTFRLTWHDAYWLDDGLAGYLHRLAIRNHKHHQGLGDVLLDWAIGLIRRQERRFVRLDMPAENDAMRQYYENRGFVYRGQVEDHDYVGALFEKEL